MLHLPDIISSFISRRRWSMRLVATSLAMAGPFFFSPDFAVLLPSAQEHYKKKATAREERNA